MLSIMGFALLWTVLFVVNTNNAKNGQPPFLGMEERIFYRDGASIKIYSALGFKAYEYNNIFGMNHHCDTGTIFLAPTQYLITSEQGEKLAGYFKDSTEIAAPSYGGDIVVSYNIFGAKQLPQNKLELYVWVYAQEFTDTTQNGVKRSIPLKVTVNTANGDFVPVGARLPYGDQNYNDEIKNIFSSEYVQKIIEFEKSDQYIEMMISHDEKIAKLKR